MKALKHKLVSAIALVLAVSSLAACGSSSSSTNSNASAAASSENDADEVRTITYAFTNTLKPASYLDENGQPAGYDVEVLKLVDERLPQYEIKFVGTTSEDAWMGVESGKYQICTTNSFRTAERESKYIFADQNQGGNLEGLVVRNEHADVKTLEDVAAQGLKMVPMRPSDAVYSLVNDYNTEHPDNQIALEAIDQMENADAIRYVAEGRYDVFPYASTMYEAQVAAEDGDLHALNDQLTFNIFSAISTWGLINKDETEFRDAYQEVLHQLKDDGTLSALSEEYFGIDIFQYFD